jgi:hypothetical protein
MENAAQLPRATEGIRAHHRPKTKPQTKPVETSTSARSMARVIDRCTRLPKPKVACTHMLTGVNGLSSQDPDEAPVPEPGDVAALLDKIPDAYERAQLGQQQAKSGETIPLDEL